MDLRLASINGCNLKEVNSFFTFSPEEWIFVVFRRLTLTPTSVKVFCLRSTNERVTRPAHSVSIWSRQLNMNMSAVEFTRRLTFPRGEIQSQPNQLSAHVVNFRSKQLDLVFTPKDETTGPADHSTIKKIKIKS